jgi:hypothetical protein
MGLDRFAAPVLGTMVVDVPRFVELRSASFASSGAFSAANGVSICGLPHAIGGVVRP